MQKTSLLISGMTCAACEKLITKRIQKIGGVSAVVVSAQRGSADITAIRPISTDEVVEVLQGTNYSVITH